MSRENKYLEMWAQKFSSSNEHKYQLSYCNFFNLRGPINDHCQPRSDHGQNNRVIHQ